MSTDSGNRKYQALALGTSYALGTFNDNFFKQAGLLLAVTTGNAVFQSQVTFLFALPFVLFSAWSGWLADRFAKKSLVICAKTLELAAMLAGAWGMVTLDWNWMLAMTFCMGLSSTLFSPALNGSIPELFPVGQVPRINALFKLGTTASILFGVFLAGIALDQAWIETAYPFGRWLVAILAVTVAAGGLVSTAFIPAYPGAGSRNPFPWSAVIDSFRFLRSLRKDGPLHLVIWAEAFFYFLSTLLLLEINNLGGAELGLSYTATSFLPVALMVGICAGSLLAARGTPESWRMLLVPAIMGIGVLLCLVPVVAAARSRAPASIAVRAVRACRDVRRALPHPDHQLYPSPSRRHGQGAHPRARQLPFFHRNSACGPTVSAPVIVAALARACGPRHSQLGRCLCVSGRDAWFRAASKP